MKFSFGIIAVAFVNGVSSFAPAATSSVVTHSKRCEILMAIPDDLINTRVLIESKATRRLLFADGEKMQGERGDEGGWLSSSGFEAPKMVGSDAN